MRKLIISLIWIFLILILGFIYFKYIRRTPFAILAKSGIVINSMNTIIEFQDEWGNFFNIHGDGEVIINIHVDHEPFENVIKQIDLRLYKSLPIQKLDYSMIPYRFINSVGKKGFYQLKKISNNGWSIIIIDEENKKVLLLYQIY